NAINQTNMNTAVGIIERRVNGLGVQEAEVQTQGDRHIIANIPRGTDEKQAREQVGTTAKLAFRPVLTYMPDTQQPPSDSPSKPGGEAGKGSGKGQGGDKGDQGRAVTDGLKAEAAPSDDDPGAEKSKPTKPAQP